ncbi:MAG: UbiD family decarboxylase [Rhodobacteraceae bacterium]|jgi:4-hydroxy-3-polyprenylbenzoate decarboxylase|nr:UbiD family decarboxylase [Paracoccaceae bacterium]
MSRRDAGAAARDLRAALLACGDRIVREGFSPDEAAADFAATCAGPPARGRRRDEPLAVYPQVGRAALCFGAYGSEARVRGWLPGLPQRLAPGEVARLRPVDPVSAPAAALCDLGARGLENLPVPQVTARDAGRYLTMGFVLAEDGEGKVALSAHRMLMIGPDRLGLWMLPSRRLREMAAAAHARGAGLPVSVNIGVPPAVAVASATGSAHLPPRWSKLSLAGALAGAPVALSAGVTPGVRVLSHAEVVVEGEILAESAPEALPGRPLGGSMPEFLGYDGHGQEDLAVLRVTSVRTRPSAVFQAVVGPGREQSVILGLGGALTLALALGAEGAAIHDLRFSHAGGGMLLLFIALGRDRPADLAPLAARAVALCPFAKTVVFVDSDVDLGCEEDVLWAMTTRAQLADDCHAIPGQRPMRMDPSQSPDFLAAKGTGSLKCYVDATVPPALWSEFRRSFEPA